VTLSSCGINVRGRRSRRLRVNYRTTDAIPATPWTLQGETFDDLDEGTDDARGEVSLRSGPAPRSRCFETLAGRACLPGRASSNASVKAGVPPAHICITARTHGLLDRLLPSPPSKPPASTYEKLGQDEPRTEHVRMATMHRVKGLEFPIVFLVGANEGVLPIATSALDDPDAVVRHHHLQRERCLLYVATSRARDQLYVTSHGTPSSFLPA
jgi:hypothetical protein